MRLSLKQYLMESVEESNSPELIKTQEEAIKWFFGDKTNFSDEEKKQINAIKFLYKQAEELSNKIDENGNPIIPYPFVKNYKNTKKDERFAVRRWVETNTEWMNYCSENDIDPSEFFKQIGNKKSPNDIYHNTKLQAISEFPGAADHEILLAMSANMKSFAGVKDEDRKEEWNDELALKYALFGKTNEDMSPAEQNTYDKFLTWYKTNKDYVKKLANGLDVDTSLDENGRPELFRKLGNNEVQVMDDWKKNDGSDKKPNHTPKTDIMSSRGKKMSVKNGDTGAQAMSGGKDETMAILLRFKHLLDDEDQKLLDSLFDSDWTGKNSERNKILNDNIKKLFDKEKNPEFVMAVIAESITGSGKYGTDVNNWGSANKVLTFGVNGCFEEDMETYIYRTFEEFDVSKITINHKSSGATWAALRIFLPKHSHKYENITSEERKKNKKILDVLSSVTKINQKKQKSNDRTESEETAEIEGKKVTIRTGEKGGKYYINDNGTHIYVDRKKNGSYEIRKVGK